MKKIFKFIFSIISLAIFTIWGLSFSYQVATPPAAGADIKEAWTVAVNDNKFKENFKIINRYLWIFMWVISMWVIIYAWVNLISSEGNEENLKKANKTLIYWLVWIVISLGAYVIINVAINIF